MQDNSDTLLTESPDGPVLRFAACSHIPFCFSGLGLAKEATALARTLHGKKAGWFREDGKWENYETRKYGLA